MHVRTLMSLTVLLALGSPVATAAPVPRETPALTVTDVLGQGQDLSQFKGDVMVIEFMLIRCSGCLRMAQTINKLHAEMGSRGFQSIAVAFDDGVNAQVVRELAQLLKLDYPVGYTTSDEVDRYLMRAPTVRFQLPQVAVIDRAGAIRAQSRPSGETDLTNESYLRNLVRELLKEVPPSGNSDKSAVGGPAPLN
jgi:peroxiredoxin